MCWLFGIWLFCLCVMFRIVFVRINSVVIFAGNGLLHVVCADLLGLLFGLRFVMDFVQGLACFVIVYD